MNNPKTFKRAAIIVWIMAIVGIMAKYAEENMRIVNISVEVTDEQYMALKRRAARVGKKQDSWTIDDEINYTASAALAVMADEELRRERVALRNAQITDDFITDDTPIAVAASHKEIEKKPTLSDDPTGEPEAADDNQTYLFMQEHITEAELDLFMRCVQAEAGNQSLEGKTAAAEVIRNRVNDPRFPGTVTEVINAPGQFTVVSNGRIDNVTPDDETIYAVQAALSGSENIPEDYVFFNNAPIGSDVIQIGDHYFGR